jgi:beta-glucosidase
VLLKNKGGVLPLKRQSNVLVAGSGADNISKQAGGWSITWQGTENSNADFPGATSVLAGIRSAVTESGGNVAYSATGEFSKKPDAAVVVFGEEPYAEGAGNVKSIDYASPGDADLQLLQKLKSAGVPVVAVFLTGRPLWVNPELNASDAFVVAWLPGTEGSGIADVIFRNAAGEVNHDFTGKLSFSWPKHIGQLGLNRNDAEYQPLFPYGFGLTYRDRDALGDELPMEQT